MAQGLPDEFKLERYFARYEFCTRHLLSCSDAEAPTMAEIVAMADEESKKLWDELRLGYTESSGHPLLRKEVAEVHGVDADDVLIIAPQEGIYIAMHCLVDFIKRKYNMESFHVVTTFPGYQSLYENLRNANCEVSRWTASNSNGSWTFSLEEFKSMLRENTRVVVVNFPHNPTGYCPSESEWNDILETCRSRKIFLFSDEMYRFTNYDGSTPLDTACARYDDAITLFGMSKTLAMPGLRIGWLCTKNAQLMTMMQSFKDYITICSAGPSEVLSIIGLRNREKIIQETVSLVKENIQVVKKLVEDYPDLFEWIPSKASTTGFVKVKGWITTLGSRGASGFCKELVEKAGILLVPAAMFDFQDEYVRVGLGRKGFAQGVAALREFLDSYPK